MKTCHVIVCRLITAEVDRSSEQLITVVAVAIANLNFNYCK
jgi:hypothetical protein